MACSKHSVSISCGHPAGAQPMDWSHWAPSSTPLTIVMGVSVWSSSRCPALLPPGPVSVAGSGLGAHIGGRVAGAPSAPTLGLGILLSFPSLWPPLLWPSQLMCPLQSWQLPVTLPRSSEAACHSERWVKERARLILDPRVPQT